MIKKLFFAGAFALATFALSTVRINEVVPDNDSGHQDALGDYSDWIELYNDSSSPVDLTGYYLSDDELLSTKWQFPSATIGANSYLVIIASSEDTIISSEIHTNFSLSKGGEFVSLHNASNVLVDSVTFPSTSTDLSYARNGANPSEWIYATPTFEAVNESVSYVFVEQPTSSHTAGFYPSAISVTYTCPDAGAEAVKINFTGTVQQVLSSPYTITSNEVIRTACRDIASGTFSDEKTDTYFINESSTLPVVSLSTDQATFDNMYNNYSDNIEIVGHVELFNADGTEELEQDLEMEIHGSFNATKSFPMKSIRLTARNSIGKKEISGNVFSDRNYNDFKQIILRNAGNDYNRLLFRDLLNARVARETNVDWQAGQPALMFVNGNFQGLYNIRERNKTDYVTKLYGYEGSEIDYIENNCDVTYPTIGNYPDEVREGDASHFINAFEFATSGGITSPGGYDQFKQWFDMDNFMDYFAVQCFHVNWDWPYNNVRMWRPKTADGKWRYIYYDTDFSLHLFNESRTAYWIDEIDRIRQMDNNPHSIIFNELLQVEEFRCEFKERLLYLMTNVLTAENYMEKFNELDNEIAGETQRQRNMYGDQMACCRSTVTSWVTTFINQRTSHMLTSVQNNLGSYSQTTLNVTPANSGTIIWNENLYDEFPVDAFVGCTTGDLTAVPAEGYRFVQWSNGSTTSTTPYYANATAEFEVFTDYARLVVSEFMYKTDDYNTGDEWVEIYNPGVDDLDISNWVMKDDNDLNSYTLPSSTILAAGEAIIIAADSAAFKAQYPSVSATVLGNFDFGLGNGSDAIRFFDNMGTLKYFLSYTDENPWPALADGYGASVAIIDAEDNSTAATNFTQGCYNGDPGVVNTNCSCTPVALGSNISACSPAATLSNPIAGASSFWYFDGDIVSTSNSYNVTAFGEYTLISIENGCMSTDDISVLDGASTTFELVSNTSTICGGETNIEFTLNPTGGTITSVNSFSGVSNTSFTGSTVTTDFASTLTDNAVLFSVNVDNNGCTSTTEYTSDLSNCNLVCEGTLSTTETEICGGAAGITFTFDTELTAPVSWNIITGIDNYSISGNTITIDVSSNVSDATTLFEASVTQGACTVSDDYVSDISGCNTGGGSCSNTISNTVSDWTFRNNWNDIGSGSTMSNTTEGIQVNHRAWGYGEYWLTYNTPFSLTSGTNYTVELDIQDNNGSVSTSEIKAVFTSSLAWNGPNDQSISSTVSGPFSSSAYETVSTDLNANGSGNYYLCLLFDLGVGQVSSASTLKIKDVKVCGLSSSRVALEVNPTSTAGSFTANISSDSDEVYHLQVSNLNGQEIYRESGSGFANFDFGAGFEKGIYIVQVITQNETITQKIIKE